MPGLRRADRLGLPRRRGDDGNLAGAPRHGARHDRRQDVDGKRDAELPDRRRERLIEEWGLEFEAADQLTQTRQTAELYGLGDRGLLQPGLRADLNVIDYDRLTFGEPRMAWDLPGGAPRLVQKAKGYRHTFCAGVETVVDDEHTGRLPGRLVRGPR